MGGTPAPETRALYGSSTFSSATFYLSYLRPCLFCNGLDHACWFIWITWALFKSSYWKESCMEESCGAVITRRPSERWRGRWWEEDFFATCGRYIRRDLMLALLSSFFCFCFSLSGKHTLSTTYYENTQSWSVNFYVPTFLLSELLTWENTDWLGRSRIASYYLSPGSAGQIILF